MSEAQLLRACHICSLTFRSLSILAGHVRSKKHRTLALPKCPQEFVLRLQYFIDAYMDRREVLVGLQYIQESVGPEGYSYTYTCLLCDVTGDWMVMLLHVTKHEHKSAYLHLRQNKKANKKLLRTKPGIRKLAQEEQQKYGHKRIRSCDPVPSAGPRVTEGVTVLPEMSNIDPKVSGNEVPPGKTNEGPPLARATDQPVTATDPPIMAKDPPVTANDPRASAKDPLPRVRAKDPPPRVREKDPPRRATARDSPPRARAKDSPPRARANYSPPRARARDSPLRARARDSLTRVRARDSPPRARARHSPPQARARDSPPRARARDSPPQARARDSPPRARARDSPPRARARDSPPQTRTNYSPPQARARDSPPRVRARDSPPRVRARDSPPRVRARDSPPRMRVRDSPPRMRVRDSPPRMRARDSPPRMRERDSPPRVRERDSPPRMRERDSPPRMRERDSPPRMRERDSPPRMRERDSPPRMRARDSPPRVRARDSPPRMRARDSPPRMRARDSPPLKWNKDPQPGERSEVPPSPAQQAEGWLTYPNLRGIREEPFLPKKRPLQTDDDKSAEKTLQSWRESPDTPRCRRYKESAGEASSLEARSPQHQGREYRPPPLEENLRTSSPPYVPCHGAEWAEMTPAEELQFRSNKDFLIYLNNFEIENDEDVDYISWIIKNCIHAVDRFAQADATFL